MTKKNDEKDSSLGKGIALGLCFGAAIGVLTKNIGLWISLGLCLGVAFGNRFPKNKNEN